MTGAFPGRFKIGISGKTLVLLLLLILPSALPARAQAGPSDSPHDNRPEAVSPLPFRVGEELTFDLTWIGIKGGTARMAVTEKTTWAGTPVYHFVTTAESAPVISAFYRVEDRVESFVATRGLFPLYFHSRQREGHYLGVKEIFFDPSSGKATYRKNREPAEVFSIPPRVQDALSAFYYLRTLPFAGKAPVRIETFDSKKTWSVEVRLLGREVIKTLWGRVEALKVKPLLKSEGIFRRKGDVVIWLTEDSQHLPLMMESKVVIGSIAATLVHIRGAKPPVPAP